MLLTTIPTDLIHDIFLMLDDRRTLMAFILTNRLLYEVFKAHPNAILGQVVCNEIGMDIQVLPYAWATIDSQFSQYELPEEEFMEREIKSQESFIVPLTRWKFVPFQRGHAIVQSWAKHYSIRFKEGRILRDTLTAEESRRFHIAVYLFLHYRTVWNVFQAYAMDVTSGGDDETDEVEAREDAVQDAKTMDVCDGFLASLSTDELLWIQEFSEFLLQDIDDTLDLKNNPTYFDQFGFTARNAVNLSIDSWRHFLLSTSVDSLGDWDDIFIDNEHAPTHLQRKELWLTGALSRILQQRGFQAQAKDEKILKSKGILITACQKCGLQPERRSFLNKTSEIPNSVLASPANFISFLDLEEFPNHWNYACFPGEMALNPIETGRACKRIHSSQNPPPELELKERLDVMKEIMAHAEAQAASLLENGETSRNGLVVSDDEDDEDEQEREGAQDTAEYKWSPDDVLCEQCFFPIFSDLYYAWWLEERQTDRVEAHTFSEDLCWWGNECRTQRRYDHASRRDHCCPRTKGIVS